MYVPKSGGGGNGAMGDRDRRFGPSFAELSSLVLVFGAMIYVLGFLAFLVPIWKEVTHDVPTAMYATSLVPRTVSGEHRRARTYRTNCTITHRNRCLFRLFYWPRFAHGSLRPP